MKIDYTIGGSDRASIARSNAYSIFPFYYANKSAEKSPCKMSDECVIKSYTEGRNSTAFSVSGRNSGVECNLAKVDVEGSNPFARSNRGSVLPVFLVSFDPGHSSGVNSPTIRLTEG